VESLRTRKHNAGMAVAVFNSNETSHLSTHGFADIESKRPVTASSLFMIGSTTKAMTATAAGFLVQEGLLSWDDLVKDKLPAFSLRDTNASENATLRDLLLHRTGLPRHDFAWLSRTWTSEQYLTLLPKFEPSAEFRSKWQYQNLMYMTAGMVIGRASNSDWADIVDTKIFKNLGMSQTRSLTSRLQSSDDLALPHAWDGQGLRKIPARNIDGVGPAGSVHSSILDMVKWGQFNLKKGHVLNGVALSKEIIAEIHRPQISTGSGVLFPEFEGERQYALGWAVGKYRGETLIGHGGGIDGYLTSVYFSPAHDVGIIVLTNGGDLTPDIVMMSVLDHVIGAESVDWLQRFDALNPTAPVPGEVEYPASYELAEGDFEHPVYGTFHVQQTINGSKKSLTLDLNGGYTFNISPWLTDDAGVWKSEDANFLFLLNLDEKGAVTSIEANLEPTVQMIKFQRTFVSKSKWSQVQPFLIKTPSPLSFD